MANAIITTPTVHLVYVDNNLEKASLKYEAILLRETSVYLYLFLIFLCVSYSFSNYKQKTGIKGALTKANNFQFST